VQRKQAAAEEPITARIRRQHAHTAGGEPGLPGDLPKAALQASEPANDNHYADNDNRPPVSFAERIVRGRGNPADHDITR
jgi:hypothetical protein